MLYLIFNKIGVKNRHNMTINKYQLKNKIKNKKYLIYNDIKGCCECTIY